MPRVGTKENGRELDGVDSNEGDAGGIWGDGDWNVRDGAAGARPVREWRRARYENRGDQYARCNCQHSGGQAGRGAAPGAVRGEAEELEDLNKQINDIQQRLNASADVMSDDEKEKLTTQGQDLSRQLQRKQTDYQEDLNEAQSEAVQRISERMVDLLGKYAPSNGYQAVLDDSSQTTPVMYASTDITEQIVKLYDQTYPVKSADAAGDPKPAGKRGTRAAAKPSGQ